MPLITAHLLQLSPGASISKYLRAISSSGAKPLLTSRAIRWIIQPEKLSKDQLLQTKWDLLIIVPKDKPLLEPYLGRDWVANHWSITAGMPSKLFTTFNETNKRLLSPNPGDVPELTGAINKPKKAKSAQGLELNDDILDWSKGFKLGQQGAVSMLNLLAFKPGEEAHKSYQQYGAAFAESIGSRRGGNAKIVGKVVPNQNTKDEDQSGWDEIALAHYPSINHFVDMLASEDYQEVNHSKRLPALRDTCILCTSELDPDLHADKAKL